MSGASLSASYLGSEVPPGEEEWPQLYFWEGMAWWPLETKLDTYHNIASAGVRGPSVSNAFMSALEIPLFGPGWNLFAYPVQGSRPVTEATISVTGYHTTVCGYEPADASNPWRIYDMTVPASVNDLDALQFGCGYWINIAQSITLRLRGGLRRSQSGHKHAETACHVLRRGAPATGLHPSSRDAGDSKYG